MIIGVQMGATSGCAVFKGGGVFYMLQVKNDLQERKTIRDIQPRQLKMRLQIVE